MPSASASSITQTLGTYQITGAGNFNLTLTAGANVSAGGSAALIIGNVTDTGTPTAAISETLTSTQNTTTLVSPKFTVGSLTGNASATFTTTYVLTGTSTAINTVSGVIANGTGGTTLLTKSGAGTWALTQANTYGGITTISAGSLIAQNPQALGLNATPAALTLNGGTLDIQTNTSINPYNTTFMTGFLGTSAIVSDTSTAVAGITHTLGTLSIGSNQLNITQGTNATGNTAALKFGPVTLNSTTSATSIFNPTTAAVILGSVTSLATTNNTNTLVLDGTNSTGTTSGAIGNGSAGGTVAVTKSNTSTWTLNGVNTYTGATSITGGTLNLGASGTVGATLANTAVTVGSGATFAAQPGVVTATSNGSLAGTLTLGNGANFTMADGVINQFNITGAAPPASRPPRARPRAWPSTSAGSSTTSDLLNATGAVTVGGATTAISVVGLTGVVDQGSYTVIQGGAGSTLGTANLTLATTSIFVGANKFNLSLANSTSTQEIVTATQVLNTALYWFGGQDGNWNTLTGGTASNFTVDPNGTINSGTIPVATSDVFFSAAGATNLGNSQLGQSFTINTLNFTAGSGAAIIGGTGGFTLTVNAASGTGITDASTVNQTITAGIVLGASQTWTNSGTGTLIASGGITNGGFTLTTAGSGNFAFTGLSGTGGLTLTGSGTVAVDATSGYTGVTAINSGVLTTGTAGTLANGGSNSSIGAALTRRGSWSSTAARSNTPARARPPAPTTCSPSGPAARRSTPRARIRSRSATPVLSLTPAPAQTLTLTGTGVGVFAPHRRRLDRDFGDQVGHRLLEAVQRQFLHRRRDGLRRYPDRRQHTSAGQPRHFHRHIDGCGRHHVGSGHGYQYFSLQHGGRGPGNHSLGQGHGRQRRHYAYARQPEHQRQHTYRHGRHGHHRDPGRGLRGRHAEFDDGRDLDAQPHVDQRHRGRPDRHDGDRLRHHGHRYSGTGRDEHGGERDYGGHSRRVGWRQRGRDQVGRGFVETFGREHLHGHYNDHQRHAHRRQQPGAGLNASAAALTLSGGTLDLAVGTNTASGINPYNTTVTASTTIMSDVGSGTSGFTQQLGTLSIPKATLTFTAAATVTSGTPAVAFGNVTLNTTAGAVRPQHLLRTRLS